MPDEDKKEKEEKTYGDSPPTLGVQMEEKVKYKDKVGK